ncbi:MAG: 1-acyl-sn-glycerol-3-phosphate acyltransferase [Planctomycetes bacterium]|nr:1-acyl-sn-glycerol-3-phosphate acyltransferase [Planctomycetota bacterium]MCC7170733.1 1-acyl-sn-glycerol-3-phosphate acyltransferase [Planctomycetota bacterium]
MRLLAFAVWTAFAFVVWVTSRALVLVSRRAADRARASLLRAWARGVAVVLGMRVVVNGTPPRGAFFLVANHLSYLDVFALWTVVEGTFLSKAEIARWPVIGFLARSVGTMFVARDRRLEVGAVVERLQTELDRGRGVIVFPEGTSSAGETVLAFKPSMFEAALRMDVPVRVVALRYEAPSGHPAAAQSLCWWGDMDFLPHFLGVFALPRFAVHATFAHEPVRASDRKQLARAAHAATLAVFEPSSIEMNP